MILSYVGTYVRLQCRERPAAENMITFKRRKHQHLHILHIIHNITAGIFCRVCVSGPFVQPHSMWLHVAAKPCIKMMIVRLFLLHLFANTKSEIWIISHCLGFTTQWYAPCLAIFLFTIYQIYFGIAFICIHVTLLEWLVVDFCWRCGISVHNNTYSVIMSLRIRNNINFDTNY